MKSLVLAVLALVGTQAFAEGTTDSTPAAPIHEEDQKDQKADPAKEHHGKDHKEGQQPASK